MSHHFFFQNGLFRVQSLLHYATLSLGRAAISYSILTCYPRSSRSGRILRSLISSIRIDLLCYVKVGLPLVVSIDKASFGSSLALLLQIRQGDRILVDKICRL